MKAGKQGFGKKSKNKTKLTNWICFPLNVLSQSARDIALFMKYKDLLASFEIPATCNRDII